MVSGSTMKRQRRILHCFLVDSASSSAHKNIPITTHFAPPFLVGTPHDCNPVVWESTARIF